MADIAVYFDNSGLVGMVGPETLWEDVVNWQGQLPTDKYLTLHRLMERGWDDDLSTLQQDLTQAIEDHHPTTAVANGLGELLKVLDNRKEEDGAIAVALSEEEEGGGETTTNRDGEEVTDNELSFSDITRELERRLAEKYGSGTGGGLMNGPSPDIWPVDVYADYVIYRRGDKFYTLDYSVDSDDKVTIGSDPVEVMRVTDYVPVKNADGTPVEGLTEEVTVGNAAKKLPSGRLSISPAKACQILKDGSVRGHPLTKRQRGLFGVICGRMGKKKTMNADGTEDTTTNGSTTALSPEELRALVRELPALGQPDLPTGEQQAERVRSAIRNSMLYHNSQEEGPSEDVREAVREVANQDAGHDTTFNT